MSERRDKFIGNVGEGFVAFGRFQAITGAVVAVLIGIGMIIGGAFMVRNKHTESVVAVVQGMYCGGEVPPSSAGFMSTRDTRPTCAYAVTYAVKGQSLSSTFEAKQFAYRAGESVTIYYDPENPLSISTEARTLRIIGWVLIAFGIVIPLLAIATAVFAVKSKTGAGIVGAGQFANMIF